MENNFLLRLYVVGILMLIFSLGIFDQLAFPLPPTPITATLSLLFGEFFKKPGIKINPVEAKEDDFINDLREK